MKHKLISAMLCMTLATSCVDMDIAPKNIVTSESLLSNESGMDIYMARLYSICRGKISNICLNGV